MRLISNIQADEIGEEMLNLIESMIVNLECLNSDLEYEFGGEILTKKIGEGFNNGTCKYSLRDRYGRICDELLNTSFTIAHTLGVKDKEFRNAIDEVVGNSRVYDGEYDSYSSLSPSEESLEIDRGSRRWWKPRS